MVENITPNGTSRRTAILNLGMAAAALALSSGLPARSEERRKASKRADGQVTVGMVLFDGFQLLDVFGPLEMFSGMHDKVRIVMVAERTGLIQSIAGVSVQSDFLFAQAPRLDVLLIPGGMGTRREVDNPLLIEAIKSLSMKTEHVASICTGAALLARTGLLDGRKATTNKRAFQWATSQGPAVQWVKEARWVEDGKYFTSSGISAGMDMSLGLIAKLFGRDAAQQVADGAEYTWHSNPTDDPFARLNGLVGS